MTSSEKLFIKQIFILSLFNIRIINWKEVNNKKTTTTITTNDAIYIYIYIYMLTARQFATDLIEIDRLIVAIVQSQKLNLLLELQYYLTRSNQF